MSSKPPLGLPRLSLALFAMSGCALSASCATKASPSPFLSIPVAENLRTNCPPADNPEAVQTVGDLAAFSIRQEAALQVCDARRGALVATIDAANAMAAQVAAKPRKRFLGVF